MINNRNRSSIIFIRSSTKFELFLIEKKREIEREYQF